MHKEKTQQKRKKKERSLLGVRLDESKQGQAGRPDGPWGAGPRGTGSCQSQPQKRLRRTFKAAELTPLLQGDGFHRQLSQAVQAGGSSPERKERTVKCENI